MHGSGGRKKDRGRRKKSWGWVIRAGVLLGSRYVPAPNLSSCTVYSFKPCSHPKGQVPFLSPLCQQGNEAIYPQQDWNSGGLGPEQAGERGCLSEQTEVKALGWGLELPQTHVRPWPLLTSLLNLCNKGLSPAIPSYPEAPLTWPLPALTGA